MPDGWVGVKSGLRVCLKKLKSFIFCCSFLKVKSAGSASQFFALTFTKGRN